MQRWAWDSRFGAYNWCPDRAVNYPFRCFRLPLEEAIIAVGMAKRERPEHTFRIVNVETEDFLMAAIL